MAAFRLLLSQKRDTVMKAKQRYTNGLDKLAFAESQVRFPTVSPQYFALFFLSKHKFLFFFYLQVGEMKIELVALQPQLEQSKIDNTKMMKVKCIFPSSSTSLAV